MSYQALLFCPEEKTARVVTQVLTELDFTVEPCNEPFAAVKRLMAQHFDAIVVDCDNEQNATLLFKSARNSGSNQSSLSVAVVEGQAGVAKAFRIGANLVLTKPINVEQSKGTLRVARGLLRKADAAKPAGAATLPAGQPPARPAAVVAAPSKTTFTSSPASITQPMAAMSAKPTSAFELEKEPAPEPEPEEAALLESMHDPVTTKPLQPAVGGKKEYPWQPVSKPLSEPMASALRRAAEAANKPTESVAPAIEQSAVEVSSDEDVFTSGSMFSGEGAATAAAPAKEMPQPAAKKFAPKKNRPIAAPAPAIELDGVAEPGMDTSSAPHGAVMDAPASAELSVDDQEESRPRGSRKGLLTVLALVVVLAAAYFGWTRMNPNGGLPFLQKQAAPAIPAPAARPQAMTATPQTTGAIQETTVPGASSPSLTNEVVTPGSEHQMTAPAAKPSAAKPAAEKPSAAESAAASEPEITVTTKQEQIVVKNDFSQHPHAKSTPDAAPPVEPAMLGVASDSDEKAISGIATTSATVPKPVSMQALRVSQGVSQGLLVKRVQPAYPAQARQMRVQGAVELQATISKEGDITAVKVLHGDSTLARAAVDAVRQWKYKPYFLNGEPVEIQTQVTVNFKLP